MSMRGIILKVLRKKQREEFVLKQTSLKDFNTGNHNNTIDVENVMDYLDVDHITFQRGDVHDEEE